MCSEEIESIDSSLDHARDLHPDTYNVEKPASCLICPQTFNRNDELHQHVWRHLSQMYPNQIPQTRPLIESSMVSCMTRRKKRVKSEQVSCQSIHILIVPIKCFAQVFSFQDNLHIFRFQVESVQNSAFLIFDFIISV